VSRETQGRFQFRCLEKDRVVNERMKSPAQKIRHCHLQNT
jgi:hypothetical protein